MKKNILLFAIFAALLVIMHAIHNQKRQERLDNLSPFEMAADEGDRALGREQYVVAEQKFSNAIVEMKKNGKEWSHVYLRFYFSLKGQGKYDGAIEAINKAIVIENKRNNTSWLPVNYEQLGDTYASKGQFVEAQGYIDKALQAAETRMQQEPNQKDLAISSLYRGIGLFYINTGDYERSRAYLQQSYDWYIREGMFRPDHSGYAQMCLAMLAYYQGDLQSAERLFYGCVGLKPNAREIMLHDKALDYRVGTGGADRVKAYIYLAKIEVHKGNIEAATNYLSQGVSFYNHINTIPEERRYKKPIEADVSQAYGRLLLAQNKPIESREAHEKAIRIRLATQGPLHPDYADALKGMADAFSAENKLTSATMCANKSLDVLDKALVSTHPRIAPTLIALASIDDMTRHAEMAAPLKVRIETILQKPLGPWKEDFLETARFYGALLKKAGKGEAAEQLERLYARQKDKR